MLRENDFTLKKTLFATKNKQTNKNENEIRCENWEKHETNVNVIWDNINEKIDQFDLIKRFWMLQSV